MSNGAANGPQKSNGAAALAALKDNWVALAAILLTGGGNFIATNQNSQGRQYDVQRVVSQINDLHNNLDDFEKRQKQILDGLDNALRNQSKMLENQNDMLTEIKKK
jgi:hypothetical protein